jgi:hypothetical protein
MGFIKREEFDALQKRLDKLESTLAPSSKKKASKSEKKSVKKDEKKNAARTTIKKSAPSKKAKVAK